MTTIAFDAKKAPLLQLVDRIDGRVRTIGYVHRLQLDFESIQLPPASADGYIRFMQSDFIALDGEVRIGVKADLSRVTPLKEKRYDQKRHPVRRRRARRAARARRRPRER